MTRRHAAEFRGRGCAAMRAGAFTLAALALAAALTEAGAAPRDPVYRNARFGYSICYPADFTPQGEAPNADGQKFIGPDGATLIVYGGHNALDRSLAQHRRDAAERLGPPRYEAGRGDWYVLSGRSGEQIYYVRTALRRGVFVSMEFVYPAARAARYDALAARLSKCFAP